MRECLVRDAAATRLPPSARRHSVLCWYIYRLIIELVSITITNYEAARQVASAEGWRSARTALPRLRSTVASRSALRGRRTRSLQILSRLILCLERCQPDNNRDEVVVARSIDCDSTLLRSTSLVLTVLPKRKGVKKQKFKKVIILEKNRVCKVGT